MSTQLSAADAEIMKRATGDADDEAGKKDEEVLELGGHEAPELTDEQKAEAEEKEKGKKRSRPWSQRVDILTARLRDAEREAAELRAKAEPAEEAVPAPDPNDEKYEFGEADPRFIRDFAAHAARSALAEERKKAADADAEAGAKRELAGRIGDGIANVEKAGAEKYDDFEAKIGEAIEARGGEPLHPMVSVAIAVSPAGADIAYRLAMDEEASARIEKFARTNAPAAALAFGELEGEYLGADHDDSDLNLSDPLDMLRMNGRMKARLLGKKAGMTERKTSRAPPPPESRARGGAGQFEAGDDTADFAAFERKYMGRRG